MGFCILAYVALVHASVVLARPGLGGVALVVLLASVLVAPLRARRPWAGPALLAGVALAALAVRYDLTFPLLALPPVALPLAMLLWWGRSLRPGQEPFITRIATKIRGPLSPEYAAYTRRVTQLWVGVFALLAVSAAALAALAPPAVWSLFTNFLNTAFIGLVFAGEYAWRRWRFRHLPHPGFIAFIRQVARAGVR